MRVLTILFTACLALTGACTKTIEPAKKGKRGDSCRAANDCAKDLSCIRGVCTLTDFNVKKTAKECKLIECTDKSDCCEEPPPECSMLMDECDAGDEFACDEYDRRCVCRQECMDQQCVFQCMSDDDCGPGRTCDGGRCVECMGDGDCPDGEMCIEGTCDAGCSTDGDCPVFNSCQEGRCVETGCTNDHECIAVTDNPRSTCNDGECQTPCETDANCNTDGYEFMQCNSGQCEYVGCVSNEECRIVLGVTPGSDMKAVCRDPDGSSGGR